MPWNSWGVSLPMVKVTITLAHKPTGWYVLAYEDHFTDGITPQSKSAPPTRKFLTQEAAINYVGRLVLGRLN